MSIVNVVPDHLLDEIKNAIATKDYGSVEIYIENGRVVQITERTIRKTTTKFSSERTNGHTKVINSNPWQRK